MDPAEAHALVVQVIQAQAPGVASDSFGCRGFVRAFGTQIDYAGPIVFADRKLHLAVEIVAFEFQPRGGFDAEVHPQRARFRDLENGSRFKQGLDAADLSRLHRGSDRQGRVALQRLARILQETCFPCVAAQRIGRSTEVTTLPASSVKVWIKRRRRLGRPFAQNPWVKERGLINRYRTMGRLSESVLGCGDGICDHWTKKANFRDRKIKKPETGNLFYHAVAS